jgi:hypothetical protein
MHSVGSSLLLASCARIDKSPVLGEVTESGEVQRPAVQSYVR